MRPNRLVNVITVLFLIVFLTSCAKMSLIGELLFPPVPASQEQAVTAPAPDAKTSGSRVPSAVSPEAKAVKIAQTQKPAETKMPKNKAQDVKVKEPKLPEAAPGDLKTAELKPSEVKPVETKFPESGKQVLPETFAMVNRNAVGCILPLSGRFAEAGNKAFDAFLLSAETFNQRSSSPWKIVVADSGDSDDGMQKAVAYLADKANVMAIVAVTGSSDAAVAASEAEKRKIPLLLITSREGVTVGRDYVFQHFLTPTQQMQALARYALDKLNVAIFSVLYPQDDYGEEMVRLFRREIQKKGGKINKAIPYNKAQTDFSEQISKLMGQKLETSNKSYASQQDAKARMFVDFEALFIPDSHLRLKMITSQLAFYDVKGFKILGTSLWHSPDLLKKGAEYLEDSVFADSFLVNGFLPETNDFVDVFYSAYGREPENIEALSYDSMEIVLGVLENDKVKTRDDFVRSLLAVDRFQGATGSVYFHGNHVAQKSAFIIKIENGKLIQVK